MEEISDKSIDLILCDLPYGKTAHKWDNVLDYSKLWSEYERIIKQNGVICLFGMEPFSSCLIVSNIKMYRYSWIWEKDTATGHLNANYKPLQKTENICVFSFGTVGSLSKNKIRFNPIDIKRVDLTKKNSQNSNWRENHGYNSKNNKLNSNSQFVQKYTGYPTNILKFSRDKNAVHPTQKPVKLLEYLIKIYTDKGETVLDNCMGSGSTGVACINTDRNFIGIELNDYYFNIAKIRINRALNENYNT